MTIDTRRVRLAACRLRNRACAMALGVAGLAALSIPAAADGVTVSVPSFLSFNVWDVTRPTTGSPTVFHIAFSDAVLGAGESVRIGVQANASDFTPPAGPAIPTSLVSWSVTNPVNGTGAGGTLSADTCATVLLAAPDSTSGSADLTWTLAAPGPGIRAGNHALAVTWKIESVSP